MNLVANPIFFTTQTDFRKWLQKNHTEATELIVGYYKVGSNKPSMTWPQSVDEALCFGWIDGVRKSIDSESYCIRFTPRKATSIWSAVNIKKITELTKQGLMQPAGLTAFCKLIVKFYRFFFVSVDFRFTFFSFTKGRKPHRLHQLLFGKLCNFFNVHSTPNTGCLPRRKADAITFAIY